MHTFTQTRSVDSHLVRSDSSVCVESLDRPKFAIRKMSVIAARFGRPPPSFFEPKAHVLTRLFKCRVGLL